MIPCNPNTLYFHVGDDFTYTFYHQSIKDEHELINVFGINDDFVDIIRFWLWKNSENNLVLIAEVIWREIGIPFKSKSPITLRYSPTVDKEDLNIISIQVEFLQEAQTIFETIIENPSAEFSYAFPIPCKKRNHSRDRLHLPIPSPSRTK